MNAERVLIIEDEPDVRHVLAFLFTSEGYDVRDVGDAAAARTMMNSWMPHIVILDVELPGENGLEFCRSVRTDGLPIIMVSSHDRDDEVVAGLETGADDYVRKPFNNRELLLRVRKLLDRKHEASKSGYRVTVMDLEVDRDAAQVWRDGREIALTPTEWNILDVLVTQRGRILSSQDLLDMVWHTSEWEGGAEMVKVSIRRLRAKIERNPKNPEIIINRWGRGYYIPPP